MKRVFISAHRFCRRHLGTALLCMSIVLLLAAQVAAQTPSAPSDLAATVVSGPQVNLTWTDNSADEHYFFIYRGTSPDGPFDWYDIAPADTTSYTDTNLVTAPIYYYQVTAFNELYGLESQCSNTAEAELPTGIPTAPCCLEGSAYGRTVYLAWTDQSWNEDEFVISRSQTGPDTGFMDVGTVSPNTGCFVEYEVIDNCTVWYRLRARNSYGSSASVGPLVVYTGD